MQSRPMTKRKRKHLNTEATERGACHVVPPRHTTTECGRPFQQMDSRRSGTERTTHRHRHESPKQKLYPRTSTANRRSTARTLSTSTARTLSTTTARTLSTTTARTLSTSALTTQTAPYPAASNWSRTSHLRRAVLREQPDHAIPRTAGTARSRDHTRKSPSHPFRDV